MLQKSAHAWCPNFDTRKWGRSHRISLHRFESMHALKHVSGCLQELRIYHRVVTPTFAKICQKKRGFLAISQILRSEPFPMTRLSDEHRQSIPYNRTIRSNRSIRTLSRMDTYPVASFRNQSSRNRGLNPDKTEPHELHENVLFLNANVFYITLTFYNITAIICLYQVFRQIAVRFNLQHDLACTSKLKLGIITEPAGNQYRS